MTVFYSLLLFLLWISRILGILFALLISFFAFDVFGQGTGFWKTLHYIPLFLTGILFLGSWFFRKSIKEAQDACQGESSWI
jgi:peptidoglycan/LPS O-acetylase OafA/YrhL